MLAIGTFSLSNSGAGPYTPEPCGFTLFRLHRVAHSMDIGLPFIFQIVLLLALPLAFVYLISVAGLVLISLRVKLNSLPAGSRHGQPDSPSLSR